MDAVKKVGLFVISIIAALICVELALRTFTVKKALSLEWLLLEDTKEKWRLDPDVIFITNRVYKILPTSDPGLNKTIVTLGDSFTVGNPVEEKSSYPSVLQQLFTGKSYTYQVINLGVGGYDTDQEFRLFQKYIENGHRPDVVVWSFYYNDIYENCTRPLFDVKNSTLVSLNAKMNWVYIRQLLYDSIPLSKKVKTQSYVLNRIFYFFEQLKGTYVPHQYQSHEINWSQLKISLELDGMEKMAQQYGFDFYPILITPQAAYIQEAERSEIAQWTMSGHNALQSALTNKTDVFTFSFSSKNASESAVLGANTDTIKDYFADKTRDSSPLGARHFNENGYAKLAEGVFNLIKK